MKRFGVLLSGGLDSTAALRWTMDHAASRGVVECVSFDYAQPHRDVELFAAQMFASRYNLPWSRLLLPEMVRLNPTVGTEDNGLSRAFVPGRNLLFLSRAASCLARSGEELFLICGSNADDANGFPDCRRAFFHSAQATLRRAFAGFVEDVHIYTPWLDNTKAEIVRWCVKRPQALIDIRESVSCYRGTRCGQCDACTLRAKAFSEVGIEDGNGPTYRSCGGDPGRDVVLRKA